MVPMATGTTVTFPIDPKLLDRIDAIKARATMLFLAVNVRFDDEHGPPHEYRYIYHLQPGSMNLQEHYDPTGEWSLRL